MEEGEHGGRPHDPNDFSHEILRVGVRYEQRHDILSRSRPEKREQSNGGRKHGDGVLDIAVLNLE